MKISTTFRVFDLMVLILLVAGFYFMAYVIQTDIPTHAAFIAQYAAGQAPFQVNFLYYLIVYVLSFFDKTIPVLLFVSVYVLSGATFAKYLIVKTIIRKEISNSPQKIQVASLASFFLLICFCLPSILYFSHDFLYLLSYPPTVWHNSTTIFAMPFVVLLFWLSAKQLTDYKDIRLLYIAILIILNVIIKPSYLFVYMIVYPLLLLKRYKFNKAFWLNLIPLAIASILVLIEYYFIFEVNENGASGKVIISPFNFMNTWAAPGDVMYVIAILASTIVSSFLFPIVALVKNRQLLKEYDVQFAVFSVLLAVIIANVLAETGERASHGNFLWQSFMCTFLLYFICMLRIIKLAVHDVRGWKPYTIEIIAFFLHVFAGLYYFLKIYSTSSYV